jgi:hypothetical protein
MVGKGQARRPSLVRTCSACNEGEIVAVAPAGQNGQPRCPCPPSDRHLQAVRTARTARAGVRGESGRIMPIPLVTAIVALIILGVLHREKRFLRIQYSAAELRCDLLSGK